MDNITIWVASNRTEKEHVRMSRFCFGRAANVLSILLASLSVDSYCA